MATHPNTTATRVRPVVTRLCAVAYVCELDVEARARMMAVGEICAKGDIH